MNRNNILKDRFSFSFSFFRIRDALAEGFLQPMSNSLARWSNSCRTLWQTKQKANQTNQTNPKRYCPEFSLMLLNSVLNAQWTVKCLQIFAQLNVRQKGHLLLNININIISLEFTPSTLQYYGIATASEVFWFFISTAWVSRRRQHLERMADIYSQLRSQLCGCRAADSWKVSSKYSQRHLLPE